MYDAVETFTDCPKCKKARLIKCFPDLFICPKCKRVFLFTKGRKRNFFRKTSVDNERECRAVLDSGNWKPVQKVEGEKETGGIKIKLTTEYLSLEDERKIFISEAKTLLGKFERLLSRYSKKVEDNKAILEKINDLTKGGNTD